MTSFCRKKEKEVIDLVGDDDDDDDDNCDGDHNNECDDAQLSHINEIKESFVSTIVRAPRNGIRKSIDT